MLKILVPIIGAVLLAVAYRSWSWPGVALVTGGFAMWALLHITRLMHVLKRASDRPIGRVASAVMLNAKLRPGLTLLYVVALTHSLGELLSPRDEQPERYRWTDRGDSHVTAEFLNGKLVRWELFRPTADEGAASDAPALPAAPPSAP